MRYVRALLLVMLMAALSGCGLAGKAVEKTTEKAAEKAVEKATGVTVDQANNSVTYKAQDGQQTTISTTEGKLPADFPIAVYKGGKPVGSAISNANNKKGWSAQIQFDAEPKEIADYYEKLLKDRGIPVSRMNSSSGDAVTITLSGASAKENAILIIARKAKEATILAVIWSEL